MGIALELQHFADGVARFVRRLQPTVGMRAMRLSDLQRKARNSLRHRERRSARRAQMVYLSGTLMAKTCRWTVTARFMSYAVMIPGCAPHPQHTRGKPPKACPFCKAKTSSGDSTREP
jgi:hypothetical protein